MNPGKKDVQVLDYVDRSIPVLARMFEKRLRGYRPMGYELIEVPPGYAERTNDLLIEWDEEQDLEMRPDSSD